MASKAPLLRTALCTKESGQAMVAVQCYDAFTGASVSRDLPAGSSVEALRKALVGGDEVLLLCTDCASDTPPVALEEGRSLAYYSLPHDEKEIFVYKMIKTREAEVAAAAENLMSTNSFLTPRTSSCFENSMSSFSSSTDVDGNSHPLVSCLKNWTRKLNKQYAHAMRTVTSVEDTVKVVMDGLPQVLVQDRAVEALHMYFDHLEENKREDADESAWMQHARKRYASMKIDLEQLRGKVQELKELLGDSALAQYLEVDEASVVSSFKDALSWCENLNSQAFTALYTNTATETIEGDPMPITAKRVSVSLDTESKCRVTLMTMRSTEEETKKRSEGVVGLRAMVEERHDNAVKAAEKFIEMTERNKVPDKELLSAVADAMAASESIEECLNRLNDIDADIGVRKGTFGVYREEFNKLVSMQLHGCLRKVTASSSTRAMTERVLNRLEHAINDATAEVDEATICYSAILREVDRRSAYQEFVCCRGHTKLYDLLHAAITPESIEFTMTNMDSQHNLSPPSTVEGESHSAIWAEQWPCPCGAGSSPEKSRPKQMDASVFGGDFSCLSLSDIQAAHPVGAAREEREVKQEEREGVRHGETVDTRVAGLMLELEAARRECACWKERCEEEEAARAEESREGDKASKNLAAQVDRLTQELEGALCDLEKTRGERDETLEALEAAQRDFEQARIEKDLIAQGLEVARRDLDNMRGERDEIAQGLETYQRDLENMRGKRDLVAEGLEVAQNDLEIMRGEKDLIAEFLEVAQRDLENMRGESDITAQCLEVAKSALDFTQRDLESMRGEHEIVVQSLEVAQRDAEAMRSERDVLAECLETAQFNVEAMRGERDALAAGLKAAQRDVQVMRGERDAKVEKFAEELGSMEKEVEKMKGQMVREREGFKRATEGMKMEMITMKAMLEKERQMFGDELEAWRTKVEEMEHAKGELERDRNLLRVQVKKMESDQAELLRIKGELESGSEELHNSLLLRNSELEKEVSSLSASVCEMQNRTPLQQLTELKGMLGSLAEAPATGNGGEVKHLKHTVSKASSILSFLCMELDELEQQKSAVCKTCQRAKQE